MPGSVASGAVPRVRTEASEAASETAFALLDALWHGPVGIGVLDRELRFERVNDALAEASGASAAEHVGRTLREVLSATGRGAPEVVSALEDAMRDVLESGRPRLNLPARASLPGGGGREWLCSYFPVTGPGDGVRGVCAVVTDATDDRERQAAIERGRDRVARLLEVTAALSRARTASDVLRVLVHEAYRGLDVSSAVAFSRSGDTLELGAAIGEASVGRSVLERLPLDAPIPVAAAARRGAPLWLESPAELEEAFPRMRALVPWADAFGALAALPLVVGGEVVGAVAFAFAAPRTFGEEDRTLLLSVAEQCALALDRARLLDAETEHRALLDAVVDNAPIGIALVDRELRFRRLNQPLADMNGLPVAAHLGKTLPELLPALPLEDVEAAWREVLRTGTPVLDFELVGETPAAPGQRRVWLESWYPVKSGGEALGIGVLARDVTRERDAEDFQRNVLGIVGHDLRNPLSALVTSARLLLRAEDLSPERAKLAARIFSNAERMERIISVLLDYARVRGGQGIPLHRQPCDLAALVEAVADECEAAHPGREVRRRGECGPLGEWDRDRLAQALANLVSNALDHSPADTAVEMTWRGEGDDVVVEVSNAGPPIPPGLLPRLFQPFRRGDGERVRARDGLGLGLFIARAIAEAHGGVVGARSGAGEPTVFTMRLPRGAPPRT